MKWNVDVHVQLTGAINFAMQQNYIPIIKFIRLHNKSEQTLDNLKLKISFEPQFAKAFEMQLNQLQPDVQVEINPVNIILSPEYLFSLTEKIVGTIHLELYMQEEIICSQDYTVELLAYDEWVGILKMPEIIAAFVTPNHPLISGIINNASRYLEKWTHDPSFTGYQTNNPNQVRLQMAAIYAALREENIRYTMPPASYEKSGQRVRLSDTVLEKKSGTCLDLAILYASCLEAIGLNPLLIFVNGHAFAGCWMIEETFPDCVEDDLAAITKRLARGIDQICVVECTDYVAGKEVNFDMAEKHAIDHLSKIENFQLAIDIMRSRSSGIRPIPMRVFENGQYQMIDYKQKKSGRITDEPLARELSHHKVTTEKTELTKQNIWERKLLDLSLRNTLLNFRVTKSTVQLLASDLPALEDALAKREEFKVLPRPTDLVNKLMDSKIFEIENEKDLINSIAQAEFKSKRLRTFLEEHELELCMKNLHRQARISIEENGANTLYLALGFLRWYESDISEKPRYAPIVLLPVDIIRKIQDKSYTIRLRDEEPQMNITLLEMLRQDFGIDIGGLDPLPADENGIDLPLIFNIIRQGVMAKSRWDVEEFSFLGLFSFNQFIMWYDIHKRADELLKNKVVASLISGKLEWTPLDNCIKADELDIKLKPTDLAVPTSADSSQMTAIYAAAAGQSFVLHGPPGTGKSQTITNMIANALYQGKSVLFVAEKMAALSVVQKRLEAIGLGPFCLELHSNKAQKKNVLDQLEATLEVGQIKKPEEYEATAESLYKLRSQLNEVVDELHTKRSFGMSLYDAIIRFENYRTYFGRVKFDTETVSKLTAEKDREWKDIIKRYKVAAVDCGGVKDSPFYLNESRVYSIELRDSMREDLKKYRDILAKLKVESKELCAELGANSLTGYNDVLELDRILQLLIDSEYLCRETLVKTDIAISDDYLTSIIENGRSMVAIEQKLKDDFDESVYEYDVQNAVRRWRQSENKWFLAKWLQQKKLIKELALYAKDKNTVNKSNIVELYQLLTKHQENKKVVGSADDKSTAYFGSMWNFGHPDWDRLAKAYNNSRDINLSMQKIVKNNEKLQAVYKNLKDLADSLESYKNRRKEAINIYHELISQLHSTEKLLCEKYQIRIDKLQISKEWLDEAVSYTDRLLDNINGIREWTIFLGIQDEAVASGLHELVNAYNSGELTVQDMAESYECNIAYAVINSILAESKVLSKFSGTQFEDTIEKYKELLKEFELLTIKEIAARLSSRIPRVTTGMANSSEIGILQKAIKSGGRMMSIRRLFDSIPTLLRRLCPCMLMSPISVAQYIDPSFPKFDLVIFDEASQIPTSEAVGAIARGENVVIVGDPKQLPPTSFFMTNSVDEENYDKEDLESLLDDCLAISMPQEHLLWHYRSRHESLIAYSNMKYYDNKLYTFPSPDDVISRVQLIPVEGYYEKGGSKQNKAEAKAVVAEIVRRLSDSRLRKDSIGVVTFSLAQQILIDDLLMEEFQRNPELEKINNESAEPIFIKNLENVQGDERDVILFSIGYGPDKDGKVSMNFGPLNREGGWRRLNVAITRARKLMLVYSVLKPEQIDLSRTRSEGVAGLKGFLEFAARGKNVLPVKHTLTADKSTHIQELIADRLRALGYEVKCNIGCSEYKIDIGIVNPRKPDSYILGIMCDGENYRRAKTARDRSVLQPSVLKSLGWNIISIWTMDWLDNSEKVINKIIEAINKASEEKDNNLESEKEEVNKAKASIIFEKVTDTVEPSYNGSVYRAAYITSRGVQENFYSPMSAGMIAECMNEIIQKEAPVSKRLLYKKVLAAWGITRSGSRVEAILEQKLMFLRVRITRSEAGEFIWRNDQNPGEYAEFRVPANEDEKRSMDDICSEEIANAIAAVVERQISLSRADLIRETAKLLGFTRLGTIIESSVERGLKEALRRQAVKISEDGERISIPEK